MVETILQERRATKDLMVVVDHKGFPDPMVRRVIVASMERLEILVSLVYREIKV